MCIECFAYTYIYVSCFCLVATEIRRQCQIPWNWSYGQLWTTIWVLRIEPNSSVKKPVLLATEPYLWPQEEYSSVPHKHIG